MFWRGGFWRFLLTLLLVGLLIGGGVALYQAGFGQGYNAGLAASAGDGTAHLPPAYGYYYPPFAGWGFPFFGPFGILLGIGFFLFVFFIVGGLVRAIFWRRGDRREGPHGWRYGGWGPYWDRSPERDKERKDQTL